MHKKFRKFCLWYSLAIATFIPLLDAQLLPRQVCILENQTIPSSMRITKMYQKLRHVPDDNVLYFRMGKSIVISRKFYLQEIAPRVRQWLQKRPYITTIVTTTGVPYKINGVPGKRSSHSAFDNELATVLLPQPTKAALWLSNPLFVKTINSIGVRNPRILKMVYVARLDGPSYTVIKRMVQDAIAVEKEGLKGGVFVDARGIRFPSSYGFGDYLMREGFERFAGAGFRAVLDDNNASWKAGENGRSDLAQGAAYYAGWYDLRNFQDIFGDKGLAQGAIAWHLASSEAVDIWSPREKGWAANLLKRGAAVTWGPSAEPYVTAFPHSDVFSDCILKGFSIAEAYWLSLPYVSWTMVLLGDPLYRPFAIARPTIIAEVYRRGNGKGFAMPLGENVPMLVRLCCVGPSGSTLPAFRGKVRAGIGIRHAQGKIAVPMLRSGESALVRVSEVEVGKRLGHPFRLYFDLQDEQGKIRQVVLEGRCGMARLTASGRHHQFCDIDEKQQWLYAGQKNLISLTHLPTLQRSFLRSTGKNVVYGGRFSPYANFIAIFMLNTYDRKPHFRLGAIGGKGVPAVAHGYSFQKWLNYEQILISKPPSKNSPRRYFLYHIKTTQLNEIEIPQGWSDLQEYQKKVLIVNDGNKRLGIRQHGAAVVELFAKKGPFRDWVISKDLQKFAAIDSKRNLWWQQVARKPVLIGTHITRISCSPNLRHIACVDHDQQARIYHCQTQNTTTIPFFIQGYWNAQQDRFIFVTQNKSRYRLLEWNVESTWPIIDVNKLGKIKILDLIGPKQELLIMASADIEVDAWVLALP